MNEEASVLEPQSADHRPSRRSSSGRRIEPLATLPVFFKLKGRTVVVTGGEPPSVWKAELASAAGATVIIYAEELCEEGRRLIAREPADGAGPIVHRAEPWRTECFENAALVIGDAANAGEAWAIRCAAQAAGVPVNVIDKPAWCDFQTATIVNRSPVVIAISTDGAAPIVGQAIRQRIEAVLGPALGAWAKLAQTVRSRVNERLAMGPERRRFWQAFGTRVFGAAPDATERSNLDTLIDRIASDKPAASLTVAGCDPADPSRLTLAAFGAMQAADRIVHDPSIDNAVLELARREAEREVLGDGFAGWVAALDRSALDDGNLLILLTGDPAHDHQAALERLRSAARNHGWDLHVLEAIPHRKTEPA